MVVKDVKGLQMYIKRRNCQNKKIKTHALISSFPKTTAQGNGFSSGGCQVSLFCFSLGTSDEQRNKNNKLHSV